IPAGQCGRDTSNLESLKNTEVPVKLIDFNALRKKVVGSIRIAKKIERKAKLDEFYESLEIGQKLTGTVRSVTNYGAFVNIGPTDGMIHVSEMFWGRPRNPAELFKPGDSVDVYIKDKDRENERISLGYKTEDTNPWKIFSDKYKVDDIVNVSIVSIMPFGAFAEIVPGVDGLIHCSQIGHRFVANPASVLKVGQSVNVKITAIDDEKNRVSLSIKALLGPEEATPEEMESAGVIIAAEEEEKEKEKEPAEVEIADIVEEAETEVAEIETVETEVAEAEVEETEVTETEVTETEATETKTVETEETKETVEAEVTESEAEQQQPEEVLENPEKPDETDGGAEEQPENQNEG
ncbi:MAG: S1 RNA-binding domain-containing protein, partial [Eubacteriales bacterium]